MSPPSTAPADVRPALVLLPTLGMGGSERKFVRICNVLAERGMPVRLAYFNEPETLLPEISSAVPVLHLERRGKYSLKSLGRLVRYVADHDVGTVVGVNFYPLSYMFPASLRLRGRGVKWLASINTTRFVRSRERRFMLLNAPLLRRTDGTVFGCEGQMRHWVEVYSLPADRAAVIYNGVDTALFDAGSVEDDPEETRSRLGFRRSDLVVVCVGMLRAEKGQLDLVESLALAAQHAAISERRLALLLVGDGEFRSEIESRVAALGLAERVVVAGTVKDVRPCLKAADVFVLPSLSETFSNAALEAAAMGLPLVLSDVDGNRELVAHGDCGMLYRAGDPAALAARLHELAGDEQARDALGARARAAVETHFSLDRMVAAWSKVMWPSVDAGGCAESDDQRAAAQSVAPSGGVGMVERRRGPTWV